MCISIKMKTIVHHVNTVCAAREALFKTFPRSPIEPSYICLISNSSVATLCAPRRFDASTALKVFGLTPIVNWFETSCLLLTFQLGSLDLLPFPQQAAFLAANLHVVAELHASSFARSSRALCLLRSLEIDTTPLAAEGRLSVRVPFGNALEHELETSNENTTEHDAREFTILLCWTLLVGSDTLHRSFSSKHCITINTSETFMGQPLRDSVVPNVSALSIAMSPRGEIFIPKELLLMSLRLGPAIPLGFKNARAVAYVQTTNELLVGFATKHLLIIDVDAPSAKARWNTSLDSSCCGVAVFESHHIAFVTSCLSLSAHRLSDGVCVASTSLSHGGPVAVDPRTNTVIANSLDVLRLFRWDRAASRLVGVQRLSLAAFDAVPRASYVGAGLLRPFVLISQSQSSKKANTPNKQVLVVGERGSPTLCVWSWPDHAPMFSHTLSGMRIVGLAASPSGKTLLVCDASSASIHAFSWPMR